MCVSAGCPFRASSSWMGRHRREQAWPWDGAWMDGLFQKTIEKIPVWSPAVRPIGSFLLRGSCLPRYGDSGPWCFLPLEVPCRCCCEGKCLRGPRWWLPLCPVCLPSKMAQSNQLCGMTTCCSGAKALKESDFQWVCQCASVPTCVCR